MCTLVVGRDVLAPGTVVLAANRDEDPRRPSDPPRVLTDEPRVAGGRDRVAGGTWLALRGREAAVAMLNRHDPLAAAAPRGRATAAAGLRSRGMLALEVASVPENFAERLDLPDGHQILLGTIAEQSGSPLVGAAISRAWAGASARAYAPFTLVFASPRACWLLALEGSRPRIQAIGSGWHVITHRDLDDHDEPRTARMLDALNGFAPVSSDEAVARLTALLAAHDAPAVCLHEGRMVTVSSSVVVLGGGEGRYLHAEGRPCERPYEDFSTLLDAPAAEAR
jgi:hypothetical protein